MKASDLYYIQDKRSFVGNAVLFWCPDGRGYTCRLEEAGLYTFEEASQHRATDIPVPFDVAWASQERIVNADKLHRAMAAHNGGPGDKPVRKR